MTMKPIDARKAGKTAIAIVNLLMVDPHIPAGTKLY